MQELFPSTLETVHPGARATTAAAIANRVDTAMPHPSNTLDDEDGNPLDHTPPNNNGYNNNECVVNDGNPRDNDDGTPYDEGYNNNVNNYGYDEETSDDDDLYNNDNWYEDAGYDNDEYNNIGEFFFTFVSK